jgi:glycosyltransferase involved in cell wall biosynthesis
MLVNNLAVSGGYQKLVLRLGRELEARGHTVTTYTLHLDADKCYSDDVATLDVQSLADGPPPSRASWKRLAASVPRDLDGLILHDESSLHALAAMPQKPQRVVWMLNNELGLLATEFHTAAIVRETLAARRPTRAFRTLRSAVEKIRERARLRRATFRVDAFAVYDAHNAQQVELHLRRNADRVYAGADIDDFEPLAAERRGAIPGEPLRVISVGVLFPHRRYEDLLDALDLLDRAIPAQLAIVGLHTLHRPYAEGLRARVAELCLENRVTFREYLDDEELKQLYVSAHAFAFVNDGLTWGIAVFEALAAGLPVIVSQTAGAAELLMNGQHAWIVPPRDPAAIAAAFTEIFHAPEEARRRAAAAREEVLDIVRWPAFATRIERLLLRGPEAAATSGTVAVATQPSPRGSDKVA